MKADCGASSRLPETPWELLVSFLAAVKISGAFKKRKIRLQKEHRRK